MVCRTAVRVAINHPFGPLANPRFDCVHGDASFNQHRHSEVSESAKTFPFDLLLFEHWPEMSFDYVPYTQWSARELRFDLLRPLACLLLECDYRLCCASQMLCGVDIFLRKYRYSPKPCFCLRHRVHSRQWD